MNEMMERAALALTGLHIVTASGSVVAAEDVARAVIEAMREPTVEMEVAGTETWLCEAAMEDRALACWHAMHDAALGARV